MGQSSLAESVLRLSDPKVVAAGLACGGRLERAEDDGSGRLIFYLSNLSPDFLTRIVNDEVVVSVKKYVSAMETVLGLISERQRQRRREDR